MEYYNKEIHDSIEKSIQIKPDDLFMSETNWKYLVGSILRGKNVLLVGHSGCGKTVSAYKVSEALNKKLFVFNMGATQDPRSTLIGNTHYDKEKGTFFAPSYFVQSIQTENAVILLDELSRAHPEASNILMTVLDRNQRFLRLDEDPNTPTIKVAKGVTFISTANVGTEYTGTRIMDRALMDRMDSIIEIPPLNEHEEFRLLKKLFSNISPHILTAVAQIAAFTRQDYESDSPHLSTIISTRSSIGTVELISDGFSFTESISVKVLPFYSTEGGVDSERTFILQKIQMFSHLDSIDVFDTSESNISDVGEFEKSNESDEDLFDLHEDIF